jgi:hypothetical protein
MEQKITRLTPRLIGARNLKIEKEISYQKLVLVKKPKTVST